MILKWIHLIGGIFVFMAIWQRKAAPPTTIRQMFRWRPIWRQREDFTKAGWLLWVSGWLLILIWIVGSLMS